MKRRIDRFEERIMLNGGKQLGWDTEEHGEFLKLKTKHHGKIHSSNFMEECMSNIPIHNQDQIIEHIEKYAKYCDLEEAKKGIIQ